jgi:hypothetical protein
MAVKHSVRENSIEAELVDRVLSMGGRCDKVQALGSRGYFDRIVVLPGGAVFFVELKRPRGGRVSPHQKLYHAEYRALGAVVALVRNHADIDALLGTKKAGAACAAPAFTVRHPHP